MNDVTKPHVLITQSQQVTNNFKVYFDKVIDDPSQYREITEFLFSATEADTFELYLNGPGGRMDACMQLVHAIANTKALVIGHILGEISSAHTNIFFAAHQHVIYPFALAMIHTFSGGFYGKGKDSLRASLAYNQVASTMYKELYGGFLTEDEIFTVLDGNQDLYFSASEIAKRIEGLYAFRKEAEQQQEVPEPQIAQEEMKELLAEAVDEVLEAQPKEELGMPTTDEVSEHPKRKKPKKKKVKENE